MGPCATNSVLEADGNGTGPIHGDTRCLRTGGNGNSAGNYVLSTIQHECLLAVRESYGGLVAVAGDAIEPRYIPDLDRAHLCDPRNWRRLRDQYLADDRLAAHVIHRSACGKPGIVSADCQRWLLCGNARIFAGQNDLGLRIVPPDMYESSVLEGGDPDPESPIVVCRHRGDGVDGLTAEIEHDLTPSSQVDIRTWIRGNLRSSSAHRANSIIRRAGGRRLCRTPCQARRCHYHGHKADSAWLHHARHPVLWISSRDREGMVDESSTDAEAENRVLDIRCVTLRLRRADVARPAGL